VLAVGEHLYRHEIATGRLVRQLAAPGPPLRHVAWAADGSRLVVTMLASGTVHVLDAADGTARRTVDVGDEATALAASPTADVAAVGTEGGLLVVVPLGEGTPRRLGSPGERIEAVGFAGDRIVTAGADGVLRVWNPARDAEEASLRVETPLLRLAVSADGRRAATADRTGRIRIHALPSGEVVETIPWHDGQVRGLAWGGDVLVSADADRRLALWDLPAS
jgi:WD40 repeat protein